MTGRTARRRSAVAPLALCLVMAACGGNAGPSPTTLSQSASSEPPVATDVALAAPEDVAFDVSGTLYISEFEGNRIDRIDDASRLHVLAGNGSSGYGGDGGPAIDAELSAPTGIAFDSEGNLLLADHHNGCIRKVDAADIIDRIWGVCGSVGFDGTERRGWTRR